MELSFRCEREALDGDWATVQLEVSGLRGGHSGINIIENRANAIKILARILDRWMREQPVRIDRIDSGNKHNAIPRQAVGRVVIPASFVERAIEIAQQERAAIMTEFKGVDDDLVVAVTRDTSQGARTKVLRGDLSQRIVRFLRVVPSGVATMNREIAGLVETSSNLAIVKTTDERITVTVSARSSVSAALHGIKDEIEDLAALAGAQFEQHGAYPPWQPNMQSSLLTVCRETYRKLYGKDPHVTAIHAGLECGIIGEKIGEQADMISMGPQLVGVHAPGEKIQISSVARFWQWYTAILRALATT